MAALPILLIVVVVAIVVLRKGKAIDAGQKKDMADLDAYLRRSGFEEPTNPGKLVAPIAEVLANNHRSTTIVKAYARGVGPDMVLCLVKHTSMGAGVAGTSTHYQIVGARWGRLGQRGDFLLLAIGAVPQWARTAIEKGLHHAYLAKTGRYTLSEGPGDAAYTLFTDDYPAAEPIARKQLRGVSSTGNYMLAKQGDMLVVQSLSPGASEYREQANAVLRLLAELDPSS